MITFNSIRSSLLRWRALSFPPSPTSIEAFGDSLLQVHDGGILDFPHGRLRTRRLVDNNGDSHIIFYDEEFLRIEFTTTEKILVDATFNSVPRIERCYQFFTVMGIKYNHVIIFFCLFCPCHCGTLFSK